MLRLILGAIAGYIVWTLIWLGTNQVLFADAGQVIADGEVFSDAGTLAAILALSVVCSLAGGIVAAKVGAARARGAVWSNAIVLLLTGIPIQAGIWNQMPAWYHISFLVLLIPMTLVGGKVGGTNRVATA